jgi:uroporphyrin-III C-methyltransferase
MNEPSAVQPSDTNAAPPSEVMPLPAPALVAVQARTVTLPRWLAITLIAACAASLLISYALWQKLSHIQDNLARQSADSLAQSVEARALANNAQDTAREAAGRIAVTEAKVGEVSVQRSQLEDLIQSLSRSRDENMVVDIESAIRLAQQQSQLTGSVEPLLAALKSAEQRVTRAAQPRLNPLQRALARDIERIKAAALADMPQLVLQIDELSRLADELPLANAVGPARKDAGRNLGAANTTKKVAEQPIDTPANSHFSLNAWWQGLWQPAWQSISTELRQLVRVSRIDTPEAALLTPEQSFFLRENLKLKLLNARLALLSRQFEPARADLASAAVSLNKYFDNNARATQNAVALLAKVQTQSRQLDLPRVDDTLAALTTAAAGR